MAAEIQIRADNSSSTKNPAAAGTMSTLIPSTGAAIETSPRSTARNMKSCPAKKRLPMIAGCQSELTGCIVPPINANAGNTKAQAQHTTIIEVHVDAPRCCARCRLSNPNTTNTLEQNGSRR